MENAPCASSIGSLIYVMVFTCSDISHEVGVLSLYMLTPRKEHWTTIKRVFRYLCVTKYYVIFYQGKLGRDSELNVHGFVNVD
jgi:hypothetical protein